MTMQDAADHFLAIKGALILAWLVLLFTAERMLPAARSLQRRGWARLSSNAVLWGINSALSVLLVVPVTVWAANHALPWRPLWWAGGLGLTLDLLLLDGLIYGWHRLNHRTALLWRFHSVHHLDRRLDTTTALRFHFGEVALATAARAVAVMVLAIPLVSVLIFETIVLAATIFHHSNLRLPPSLERALSLLVVTPAIHWVHHHRRQRDTDSNYATVLSLWDPVFRSRSPTLRTADLEIGVEGREEQPIIGLLAAPFR